MQCSFVNRLRKNEWGMWRGRTGCTEKKKISNVDINDSLSIVVKQKQKLVLKIKSKSRSIDESIGNIKHTDMHIHTHSQR